MIFFFLHMIRFGARQSNPMTCFQPLAWHRIASISIWSVNDILLFRPIADVVVGFIRYLYSKCDFPNERKKGNPLCIYPRGKGCGGLDVGDRGGRGADNAVLPFVYVIRSFDRHFCFTPFIYLFTFCSFTVAAEVCRQCHQRFIYSIHMSFSHISRNSQFSNAVYFFSLHSSLL